MTTGTTVRRQEGKRTAFTIMVSPDDLDVLRFMFGDCNPVNPDAVRLCKRAMKAVHVSRKKLGFKWVS